MLFLHSMLHLWLPRYHRCLVTAVVTVNNLVAMVTFMVAMDIIIVTVNNLVAMANLIISDGEFCNLWYLKIKKWLAAL